MLVNRHNFFIVFLFFQNFICFLSSADITTEWIRFNFAVKKQFNNWFDKTFNNKVSYFLNQTFDENKLISDSCKTSLLQLINSLAKTEKWAIELVDSSAKLPPSGLLDGTLSDLGQYDECLGINVPFSFTGQYCTLKIRPNLPTRPLFNSIHDKVKELNTVKLMLTNSQWLTELSKNAQFFYFTPMRLGVCTPSSCSATELNQLAKLWFKENLALDAIIEYDGCETLKNVEESKKFKINQWIAIYFLSVFLFLCIFGTISDLLNLNSIYHFFISFLKSILDQSPLIKYLEKDVSIKSTKNKKSFFVLLECFSLIKNFILLFNVSKPNKSTGLNTLHGIKVISMSWVILGHTYGLINPEIHEKLFISKKTFTNFFSQPFLNATLAVNTFFAISGLLTTFTLLNILKSKKTSLMFFIMTFFHRIIRLLTPYIGLLCCTMLFGQFRSGPLWNEIVQKSVIKNCEKSILPNLLFINNFINQQMCLMHTWYLSNDVQFYVFGLFIFFVYSKNKNVAFILMVLSGIVATFYSFWVTLINNYPPTILSIAPAVTERWQYILDFYYKPWCHLSSYLLGLYFGYIIFYVQTGVKDLWLLKIQSNAIFRLSFNLFIFLIGLLILYSIYPYNAGYKIPIFITSIYSATFRFFWSFFILWFIFDLFMNRNGLIYEFLCWPGFLPLSKLSYSTYLYHPFIIWYYFGTVEHRLSSTNFEFVHMFLANLFLSLLLAIVSCLIFELPLLNLQKIFYDHKIFCENVDTKLLKESVTLKLNSNPK